MDTSVFLTVLAAGLTTGGLTCFAVQGGLLTSLLSQMQKKEIENGSGKKIGTNSVVAFIVSKIGIYTVLGAILGVFGSMFELSQTVQAVIQLICGLYMIGVALQLLNIHPIFRYFIFQPPYFIQKYVRNLTRGNDQIASPAALGVMTIFIPCGTTLAMEALAISSGNAISGAMIMLTFTFTSSWVFLAIGFASQLLTEKRQAFAYKITAALLVVLGVFTVNSSLYLLGVPFASGSVLALGQKSAVLNQTSVSGKAPANFDTVQRVYIKVQPTGYLSDTIILKKNIPTELTLETNGVYTCALAFTIPSLNVKKVLKPDGVEKITFTPTRSGKLPYSCSMGMYRGEFIVE